jgi:hypothetical protein
MMPSRRAIVAGLLGAMLPLPATAAKAVRKIVQFQTTPFPYRGMLPDGSKPFLDVERNGRRGHTSPRGGIYWEDETYSDKSVLLAVPKGFDTNRPAVIVVFFHGNTATLKRDVVDRQRVVAQFEASGINGVLVAPQFAVNALDSSAGSFWTPGVFKRFMAEAAEQLGALTGIGAASFNQLPIVIAAYSGGYNPAAYTLRGGGTDRRLAGVILLDALFGEVPIFARWVRDHASNAFVLNAYGESSAAGSKELINQLGGLSIATEPPRELAPGTIAFIRSHAAHDSFVTSAFVKNPLQWCLSRIAGF